MIPDRVRRWLAPGVLVLAALLAGCATQTREILRSAPAELPRRVELARTPFIAQERYQCGPASLAMALRAAGLPASAERLVSQVYLPQREGSLQVEMLAAARRNGAFAVTLPPRMDALFREVAAGSPVVVLQNLSLAIFPQWHYAVVIGFDLGREEVLLRSGTTRRLAMSMTSFEHTWARSDHWAMVALAPGKLPASAPEQALAEAAVAFEKANDPGKSRRVYEAALARWPRNLTLQMGAGNTAYAQGDRRGAEQAFRRATEFHPDEGAGFNNLAVVLSEQGRFEEAREAAETALGLPGPWRKQAQATLEKIETDRAARRR